MKIPKFKKIFLALQLGPALGDKNFKIPYLERLDGFTKTTKLLPNSRSKS